MTTVLTLDPFGVSGIMPLWLRGTVTFGNAIQAVTYNNFDPGPDGIAGGVEVLHSAITDTSGNKVVFGHSEGARVAYGWLRKYGEASTVPTSDLSFTVTGNPERKYGGAPWLSTRGLPDSLKYDVRDFTRQYDGWADFPGAVNPNRTGLLEALWGALFVHPWYFDVASGDAGNLTLEETHTGGGTVTYEWVPTKPLPTISSFWSADTSDQDQEKRPRVEAAYSRPVTIPAPTYL